MAFAIALAQRGFDLIAVARRDDRLAALGSALLEFGAATTPLVADLTTADGRERVAQRLRNNDVEFVANVAGFGGYGPFPSIPLETLRALLAVHVTTVAELTRAPLSRCPSPTTVVNVSSLLALSGGLPPSPLPARAVYAGAKSFILAFTETLAAEPIEGLNLQVVLPGMVATEFGGGYSSDTSMSANDVVSASFSGLENGEIMCVPGLEDASTLERLKAARLAMMMGGNRRDLAQRYANGTQSKVGREPQA